MAVVFAFLGIWLISLVVALLAALQLGDFFRANDEFPLIIATLVVFVTLTTAIFAGAYAWARQVRVLHRVALALALLAFAPAFVPGFIQKIADHSTNPSTVGVENTSIAIELVVATLLAVLAQWDLVRRRWLRAAGDDDFSRWPWVTTVIGGVVVLNPIGLDILGATLKHSPTEWLWQLWASITAGTAFVLVVMALIECYIRGRIARRRLATAAPGSESTGNGETSG
jgi:hypothetical protein